MSCCGKKRNNQAVSLTYGLRKTERRIAAGGFTAGENRIQFEYRGGSVLTVTGQGTGQQYRFVGHGARMFVDLRDRDSMIRIPQLSEISSAQ